MKLRGFLTAALFAALIPSLAYASMPEENKPKDEGAVIFYAEFDGKDDQSLWRRFSSSDNAMAADDHQWGTIEDGNLLCTRMTAGYGRWGFYYGVGEDAYQVAKDKKKLFLETKFKSLKEEYPNSAILTISGKRTSFGSGDKVQMIALAVTNGKLSYGGQGGNATVTDYEMKMDLWYTLKMEIDYADRKAYLNICDENGISADIEVGFLWGLEFENIIQVSLQRNDLGQNRVSCTDYIMLWDEEFRVTDVSIKDGAENVSADSDIVIDFLGNVDPETIGGITVADSEGNIAETEITADGSRVTVYLEAGMKYSEKYTLTVPNTVKSAEGTAGRAVTRTFTTEAEPFFISEIITDSAANRAEAFVNIKNSSTAEKKLYFLLVVYDKEGNVVRIKNQEFTVRAMSDEVVMAECDIPGVKNAVVKAYIWDG